MNSEMIDWSNWTRRLPFLYPGSLVVFHGHWRWLPLGTTLDSEWAVPTDMIVQFQEFEDMIGTILCTLAANDTCSAAIIGVSTSEGLLQTCVHNSIVELMTSGYNVIELVQGPKC